METEAWLPRRRSKKGVNRVACRPGSSMSLNRHDRVVKIAYDLCRASPNYRAVYADLPKTRFKPIVISAGRGSERGKGVAAPLTYEFRPDVWGKLRSGGVDVIEIWDEQSEAGAVRDFVLAALTPGVRTFSIICFDQKTSDRAREVAAVVLSSIHDGEGRLLLDPEQVGPRTFFVPERIQNDDGGVRKLVKEKLGDLWRSRTTGPNRAG